MILIPLIYPYQYQIEHNLIIVNAFENLKRREKWFIKNISEAMIINRVSSSKSMNCLVFIDKKKHHISKTCN